MHAFADALNATTANRIAVEAWDHHDKLHGIIWDRTNCNEDDGEMGDEVARFEAATHTEIDFALRNGWETGEWVHYVIDGEWGDIIKAVRA